MEQRKTHSHTAGQIEARSIGRITVKDKAMSDYNTDYEIPIAPATVAEGYAAIETVSGKIRAMSRDGMKTADIQRALNGWYRAKHGRDLRYQHVRNVLTQTYKKD
jgi:hypothetical protein